MFFNNIEKQSAKEWLDYSIVDVQKYVENGYTELASEVRDISDSKWPCVFQ